MSSSWEKTITLPGTMSLYSLAAETVAEATGSLAGGPVVFSVDDGAAPVGSVVDATAAAAAAAAARFFGRAAAGEGGGGVGGTAPTAVDGWRAGGDLGTVLPVRVRVVACLLPESTTAALA
jgi:hypothetical protein